jgi:anaerobic selenocysteine-containing dehydrogenase
MTEATAAKLGLSAGDVAKLTTDQGEARFTVAYTRMRDDLINVDYGWWHPENGVPKAPEYGGIWESNVNTLTSCALQEHLIGTWAYNAIDCMIEKVDEKLTW